MVSVKRLEAIIGIMLMVGILIAALLVFIGGLLFLWQNGYQSLDQLPMVTEKSLGQIWRIAFSFSPLGIIELGLLTLVSIQILRVAFLCGFYALSRDVWFTTISLFILIVLIYSTIWRS